jgi:hypothetical protein
VLQEYGKKKILFSGLPLKRLTVKQQTLGEEVDMWGSVPRLEGMTNQYIDNFGRRWSFAFDLWDGEVEITDVHLNGEQIPDEMIDREWLNSEEERIACAVYGCQAHS